MRIQKRIRDTISRISQVEALYLKSAALVNRLLFLLPGVNESMMPGEKYGRDSIFPPLPDER